MPNTALRTFLEYTLHPLLLVGAMAVWYVIEDVELATLVAMIIAQSILRLVEMSYPAHSEWKQTGKELLGIIGITLFGIVFLQIVYAGYAELLAEPLAVLRESIGTDIWPDQWPVLIQVFLLYFVSEFIFYWIHRGIHNSTVLWRLSGHGFHHSFQNMHAINFLTSHPFELFFLAIPITLLSLLFGATTEVALGASVLIVVNAAFAHANVRTKNSLMGLLFTTCDQHRRHHSNVLVESNANYSCNAIIWDRLFGTYTEGQVEQTGIGPEEPRFVEKLLLPVRQRPTSPS